MKLIRSKRGQIEKLLMFVAMISIAAIAISFIRGMISRQDPCKRYEEPQIAINSAGGCLDDLAIIASQCETKYTECAKNRKVDKNPMPCYTLSKAGMLNECNDVGTFEPHDICNTCCAAPDCDNDELDGDGTGVVRYDYFFNNTADTPYGNVTITTTGS